MSNFGFLTYFSVMALRPQRPLPFQMHTKNRIARVDKANAKRHWLTARRGVCYAAG